jgi:hypothetical protein
LGGSFAQEGGSLPNQIAFSIERVLIIKYAAKKQKRTWLDQGG